MFDKNEFLEVLVKNKKKMVLSDLIFELSKTTETKLEYSEIAKMLEENPNSILDLVEMENSDINHLMTSVLQYGDYHSNNVQLPFIIRTQLEKGTLPSDYSIEKLLASLLYLTSTDNKYSSLAVDVLCGYSSEVSYNRHKLLYFLENKDKFLEKLNKAETIANNKDYKITYSDIDSLYEWRKIVNGTIANSIFDEISSYGKETVDYSLLAKFLKLDEDNYKNVNNYLNFQKMSKDLKGRKYSPEEQKMAMILAESMDISMSYNNDGMIFTDSTRRNPVYNSINFADIMDFINLYDKSTSNKPFNFMNISHLFTRFSNYDGYTSHDADAQIFKELYNKYRKDNFLFKMDEFCNYINSISKEQKLEGKIANSKLYKESTDFDLNSFMYFIGSFSKNHELSSFAPYLPSLLETTSGKKYFGPMMVKEMETIKNIEKIYSNDNFDELLQQAYKLVSLSNYRLETYTRKFIQPEHYDKFKAICDWLKSNDKDIFKNSIDAKYNRKKDKERSIEETKNYFLSLSFSALRTIDLNSYHEGLKLPFIKDSYNNHELGVQTISDLHREAYLTKLDSVCLEETKKLLELFKEGKSLTKYIDASEYDYKEISYIINKAGLKLDTDTSPLASKIKEEQELEKQRLQTEKAKSLVGLFATSNFDSMAEFYKYISEEYGLSDTEQKKLFALALEDEKLGKIVEAKRSAIKAKQIQKNSAQATLRSKERLENNIKNYGEKAVKAMRSFVEVDDCTIKRFCKMAEISEKDFRFYRKLCVEVDENLAAEVDAKCENTSRKFISFVISSSREMALEMKRCHKEKVPYDLYSHYEKYGVSPYTMASIASGFDRVSESRLINQYMSLHPSIFSRIGTATVASMKRRTTVYNSNFFLENASVSYRKKDLDQVIDELNDKGIPVCVGTLYQGLVRLKKNSKDGKKSYVKTTKR